MLLENGKSLESKLRLRKNDYIDEVVTLGLDGSFKARLVGVRADDQTAETRRDHAEKLHKNLAILHAINHLSEMAGILF
ncbi:hypothetical protein [Rubritalea tangerina]|uniref:hypothetical protein n=1 Tax=Rubritalea tangerina TaxID=430798 RepID=UPI00361E44C8